MLVDALHLSQRLSSAYVDLPSLVPFFQADAEALPFDDNSFHLYTIAFGLRNVTDVSLLLCLDKGAELRNVLRSRYIPVLVFTSHHVQAMAILGREHQKKLVYAAVEAVDCLDEWSGFHRKGYSAFAFTLAALFFMWPTCLEGKDTRATFSSSFFLKLCCAWLFENHVPMPTRITSNISEELRRLCQSFWAYF